MTGSLFIYRKTTYVHIKDTSLVLKIGFLYFGARDSRPDVENLLMFSIQVVISCFLVKLRFHYVCTDFFNFSGRREIARKILQICDESACPNGDQGVATELAWRPIAFLWRSFALSQRFGIGHNACTALSRRSPFADGVMKLP